MDLLLGIVTILVIGIVVVVGGGFLGMIIYWVVGVFDKDRSTNTSNNDLLDYSQYKQLENVQENTNEFDFEAINEEKLANEKKLADNTEFDKEDSFKLLDDEDVNPEEMEKQLVEEKTAVKPEIKVVEPVKEEKVQAVKEEKIQAVKEDEVDQDDFELDNLLDEISNETEEEVKSEIVEETKIGDELESYSIDDFLNQAQAEETETANDEEKLETENLVEEKVENSSETSNEQAVSTEATTETVVETENNQAEEIEEKTEETVEQPAVEEQPEVVEQPAVEEQPEVVEEQEEVEQAEEVEQSVETEEVASTEINEETSTNEAAQQEIERLKAQVAELNQKLSESETKTTTNVVYTVDMTEEECLNRLAVLEERLKVAKKDYRINLKEYRPLKKIMNELERNQNKLRRKDTIVAKQKIALYGVNNYVDIDKEKAQKLANELELLDGLRLSVQHCEEVIAANKDRYPILEHTNDILEEQIANLESDIEATKIMLEKIREKEGKGGNK